MTAQTLFVVVGENRLVGNTSARAVYSTREEAEKHVSNPPGEGRMWFDDRAAVVELILDAEVGK